MSLPAASRLLRSALRTQLHAANVATKPAKHPVSTGEQAFAMTILFTAILGPSGWVLAHLEDYKQKK
ncbi:cytochrome c oxidase subunit 8B, mitochondrial [Cheilinus undulatus]|uniref:cytochrome c oxidase subunit 8B, mitochondrial n=1 Tax=Cheilinus undulatus TaxID=241271 RepID=UPI001BD4B610|nr:cytochrome c oxidase subunit 8B, mitochondrial [Cheilinus undulatus]